MIFYQITRRYTSEVNSYLWQSFVLHTICRCYGSRKPGGFVRHTCVWPVLMTGWAETSVTENTEALLDAESIESLRWCHQNAWRIYDKKYV